MTHDALTRPQYAQYAQ